MIAEQDVNAPSALGRVALENLQKIENLPRLVTTVHDVADLYEMRAPADPAAGRIDDAGDAENLEVPVVRAVDITHRDDPLDSLELARARGTSFLRRNRRDGSQNDQRDEPSPEWSEHA